MVESNFYTAEEIAEDCKVSLSKAYKMIQEFNKELKAKGYYIVRGKVPKAYYRERIYGAK